MKRKTCCITGHREIPMGWKAYIRGRLALEVYHAVTEGYSHFICGFASGTDLIFADRVVKEKRWQRIVLEAAIPYQGRLKTPDAEFHRLLKHCDIVKVHAPNYWPQCYMTRNQYMVDQSSLVIAVHDGRETGGTAATMRYAQSQGIEIRVVHIGGILPE